jgi:L-threonylcarbamoyladenylate synthase
MKQAVFLDRDGTLIEDRGHLHDPSEVVFFPDTIPALRLLQEKFVLFIVTNQPGVAEGILDPSELDSVNQAVVERFAQFGIFIKEVYCCLHKRSDGCECIKPNPHYLRMASSKYDIDLRCSFVIGDHPHDVELARNAGATGIYVLTGHGRKHQGELLGDEVVTAGLWDAALLAAKTSFYRTRHNGLEDELRRAAGILKDGGVVAFPTETVYGLGASVYDAKAVARVFEIKRRPRFDPLIVHVADFGQVEPLVSGFPKIAKDLVNAFWPGPLTLVLGKSEQVPDIVTAGLSTVAVRMPRHPLALELILQAGVPIAAPSANPFGYISPTTAEHVAEQLRVNVNMILDGGPCSVGIESSILSLVGEKPCLLRTGGVLVEDIERVVGPVLRPNFEPSRPVAPGQLPHHYAPRTPLIAWINGKSIPTGAKVGLLAFGPPSGSANGFAAVEVLSQSGDIQEAAVKMFAALRRLDGMGLDAIVAEFCPDVGLGQAINDRLRRAMGNVDNPPKPK